VQPIQVVEEPVVQQVVTMNRRTVQGTPYVAGTTQGVISQGYAAQAYGAQAYGAQAYGAQAYGAAPVAVAGSQAGALALDAADGVIDGRINGVPVGVASPFGVPPMY
jgi:hypothetical protein